MRLQQIVVLLLSAVLMFTCRGTEAAQLKSASVATERTSSLATAVDSFIRAATQPAWIRWDVPVNDPEAQMCCFTINAGDTSKWKGGACSLEERSNFIANFGDRNDALAKKRETFSIFIRAEDGRLSKVKSFSEDCIVEADGVTVRQLNGIDAEESVNYLAGLLLRRAADTPEREANHIIAAIGMHRASNMTASLQKIITSDGDHEVRGHAAFWLGMKGGEKGRRFLRGVIDGNSPQKVREQAVAGIAQDDTREAIDVLLDLARNHVAPDVRKQAIFWLGQRAGDRMAGELEAATEDEDDEVKEMAVFAISQLPKEQAIPSLIHLARTHNSRRVRHQAVFWLGESGDPRALEFIEEILTRR